MRSDMKKAYYHQLGPENICRCTDCPKLLCQGQGGLSGGGPVSC